MHVWDGCSQAGIIFNQEDTGDEDETVVGCKNTIVILFLASYIDI